VIGVEATELWSLLIKEDAPKGDITCDSLDLPPLQRTAKILAKEDIKLSGSEVIFSNMPIEFEIKSDLFFKDGDTVYSGQCIAILEGHWKPLLLAERPLLNWLGHFSGIATQTWNFVEATKRTHCKIIDTRKTMPLYRDYEKQAVLDGGGHNHRANLSDAMMLKENHLALYNFNIKKAIEDCLSAHPDKHLTVEASQMAQVEIIAKTKAHRIMLDNFSNKDIIQALDILKNTNPSIEVEASGGMTLDRVKSVAKLGVDFISVGALTHSAPQADLTFLMDF
jgi:nicotinate-nucleotide pyrophosphorylase (carboxylating)